MVKTGYKYRVKFKKTGATAFVGHLDLLKFFQRAIRRSKLPIAYSEGYNPHQLVSFVQPLSLGMEGYGELMEIILKTPTEIEEIAEKLNAEMPKGMEILGVEPIDLLEKGAAKIVAAEYEINFPDIENLGGIVEDMLAKTEIIVEKETKKGISLADIRADILELEAISENAVKARLSAGSVRNLRPEIVASCIIRGLDIDLDDVDYKRLGIALD